MVPWTVLVLEGPVSHGSVEARSIEQEVLVMLLEFLIPGKVSWWEQGVELVS